MVGFATALRNAGETAYEVLADHGRWMTWNTLLALVPLALAVGLFRSGVRRNGAWWLGVIAFVLFLPNAPYVLSDVIHFFGDVRATRNVHNLRVAFVVAPIYLVFMSVGFGAYVASLYRVRRYVGAEVGPRAELLAVYVLHTLASIGVFLGRFWRFNSWDLVTAPDSLAASLDDLFRRWPLALMVLTFVSLVACTTVAELLVDGLRYRRSTRLSLRPR